MRILDRYILKNFLLPFLYCFLGFIAIWLLIDFTSNMGEFMDSKSSMRYVAYFYATQIPQIVVLVIVVIGGMGSLYGAVAGAALFVIAQNYLQALMGKLSAGAADLGLPLLPGLFHPDRWLLWLGVMFILAVYFAPTGIVGKLRARDDAP